MDMSQNPLPELTRQLICHFVICTETTDVRRVQRYGELIRYHCDNLTESGDLSIAARKINWECLIHKHGNQLCVKSDPVLRDDESKQDLLEKSKNWIFPLQSITNLGKERYALRFNRAPIINHVLTSILTNGPNYGQYNKLGKIDGTNPTLCLTLDVPSSTPELHAFRANQIYHIISRLVAYTNWRLVDVKDMTEETMQVIIACNTPRRNCGLSIPGKNIVRVVCGPVLEPITKTGTTLTSTSYIDLRSNDMMLIAMHRHGVRNTPKGKEYNNLIKRLGEAAVIVDLFEIRHGSAATVVRSGLGSSKGANYILYNSARLETLLRTFAAQVDEGVYEPLPSLDKVDLSSLEDELDWQLIYGYLLTFPELVESTLIQLDQGVCGIHLLIHYIVNFATVFSRYYRNKQILLQQRSNLMPVLYARIYLIKAVRQVLNSALALLGIQPVDYM